MAKRTLPNAAGHFGPYGGRFWLLPPGLFGLFRLPGRFGSLVGGATQDGFVVPLLVPGGIDGMPVLRNRWVALTLLRLCELWLLLGCVTP